MVVYCAARNLCCAAAGAAHYRKENTVVVYAFLHHTQLCDIGFYSQDPSGGLESPCPRPAHSGTRASDLLSYIYIYIYIYIRIYYTYMYICTYVSPSSESRSFCQLSYRCHFSFRLVFVWRYYDFRIFPYLSDCAHSRSLALVFSGGLRCAMHWLHALGSRHKLTFLNHFRERSPFIHFALRLLYLYDRWACVPLYFHAQGGT